MKTIGLLGGMSWESSTHYYQLLNKKVAQALGGLHSAKIVMVSVDFQPLERLMQQQKWPDIAQQLTDAALTIEGAGADFLLLATNTMHKVAPVMTAALQIPLLHIADATAQEIVHRQIKTVGLLGTRFTMEDNFYRDRLSKKFNIDVVTPTATERIIIDEVIFTELCKGTINPKSRVAYLNTIENLRDRGAEAVIAGCTEIGMLIDQSMVPIHLLDTTTLHVDYAINYALKDGK